MLREIIESMDVSADDVEYFGQLANQAKKDKKSKDEVKKLLKDAGAPSDIIADLTQRWR